MAGIGPRRRRRAEASSLRIVQGLRGSWIVFLDRSGPDDLVWMCDTEHVAKSLLNYLAVAVAMKDWASIVPEALLDAGRHGLRVDESMLG